MQQAVELPAGLSLSYREEAWGLERIVLDGISDHLPSDSHGTYAGILVKQDGKYSSLEEAKPESSIEEIIFEDNGSGYDYELLSVFHSTKRNNPFSVGRFGEGRKMIATSCLRNNIQIKYISRDWEAEPYLVEKVIDGESLQKLFFKVTSLPEKIEGSKTRSHARYPQIHLRSKMDGPLGWGGMA